MALNDACRRAGGRGNLVELLQIVKVMICSLCRANNNDKKVMAILNLSLFVVVTYQQSQRLHLSIFESACVCRKSVSKMDRVLAITPPALSEWVSKWQL